MSALLKLTAKLTGLDYSGEIVACGVYAQKRCLKLKNRMIRNKLQIIRFFDLRHRF